MSLTKHALVCAVLFSIACATSARRGEEDDPGAMGDDLAIAGGEGDLGVTPGKDGKSPDRACASVRSQANLVKKPPDILIVIDNSGTMTDEILAVERNINNNFADIIGASGIDYRVILLARHGSALLTQSICVTRPLSGNSTCAPPPLCPSAGPRFYHYSEEIGSHDSLRQILYTLDQKDDCRATASGWSSWLRPNAFRVIIEITDDETDMGIDDFETQLFAKTTLFGNAMNRNYVFHSIVGLAQNNPASAPWKPGDPIQVNKCSGSSRAEAPGVEYQKLSIRTGGLRFPICEHKSFDAVFREVAKEVVAGSQARCDFPVPMPPPGQQIDLETVRVEYQPGMGPKQSLSKVSGMNACKPGAFYIAGGKIILCPEACRPIQADPMASVEVVFDCAIEIG